MTGISLKTNIAAMRAQRGLNQASHALSSTLEQLSSGLRINRASDDAAGLSVATQLNVTGRVFTQAIRNLNDGASAIGIAEGALTSLRDITTRQLELAEQAANGTYSSAQRKAMNTEANKLVEEFNRIIEGTSFNGMKLLDPALGNVFVQAGYGGSAAIQINITEQLKRAVGNGYFTAGGTYNSGLNPYSVLNGDLNGDGKLDIVSLNIDVGAIAVSFGNGDGSFRAATTYGTVIGTGSFGSILMGDFNNDGILDTASSGNATGLGINLGNGNGTFRSAITTALGDTAVSLGSGDFNSDGRLDLLVTSPGATTNAVSILLGNGNGTFRLGNYAMTDNSYGYAAAEFSISVGDYNGDGKLDFTSLNGSTDAFVFIGNGDGSFQAKRTLDLSAYLTYGDYLSQGDFNLDGNLDLIVSEAAGGGTSVILLGNGNGTFKAALSTGAANEAIRVADFNGDGRLDLMGSTNVHLGNGDGTFRKLVTSNQFILDGSGVTFGDFNSDGRTDFVSQDMTTYLANGSFATTQAYFSINTQQDARGALTQVRSTLDLIEAQLGGLGATSSRLDSALNNLRNQTENLFAAAGRIMDADIASAAANMTRQKIAQQAAASVLDYVNLEPQLALLLLQ